MEKQIGLARAFFLGREKRADAYLDSAESGLTRQDFEQTFRRVCTTLQDPEVVGELPQVTSDQDLPQVTSDQMDAFYKIADSYLRELRGTPNIPTSELQEDYRNCDKLIAGEEKILTSMLNFVQRFPTTGLSRTAPVARFIRRDLKSLAEKWGKHFYDIRQSLDLQQRRLPQFLIKSLTHEFVMDLLVFMENDFPALEEKNRDVFIAAALVSAGLYREKDLEAGKDGERFLDRIPQKVSRAKKHHQETFIDTQVPSDYNDPAGRVFPVLGTRNKKPKAEEKG